MKISFPIFVCALLCTCFCLYGRCQDSSRFDRLLSAPDKLFSGLDKKAATLEKGLDRQTQKYLSRLQKQEAKLRKKLYRKDSALAGQLFDGVNEGYNALKKADGTLNKYSQLYSPHLDSLSTSLKFLQKGDIAGVANNADLQKALGRYSELQSKLNASEQAKKYIAQRQQLLKDQFSKLGMVKELKKFRKEVYYYQAQIKEYKQLWEHPDKLERKLLDLAQKIPKFREFFQKNSQLASMFSLSGGNSGNAAASLAGLQTRASINQSIIDRFGAGAEVRQQLQQNMQAAQGQLASLKQKALSLGSGSFGNGGEGELPDFKPNSQRTKSFLKRLEYGFNMQSQKARYMFPTTSDVGLSLGYKLNDKSVIGLGASYKIGLGRGWDHIAISHQGIGLRSYIDYRLKGSFWLSGGYEQNYRSAFRSIEELKNYSAWQSSGLIGVSKKISAGKKMKSEVKLLWDFLSYRQVPKTQAILFRIGYNLK